MFTLLVLSEPCRFFQHPYHFHRCSDYLTEGTRTGKFLVRNGWNLVRTGCLDCKFYPSRTLFMGPVPFSPEPCQTFSVVSVYRALDSVLSPSSTNTWLIACIAVSEPALWPAQTWMGPAASLISSFKNLALVFPTIRLRTTPTPIGRIPGFLSKGMSLQEV